MLTTSALTGFKEYVKRTVSYAKYKVGSTYYSTDNVKVYITSSGTVAIDVTIDHSASGSITVTEIQLYDTSGTLWLSKAESLKRASNQEGIFKRFTIEIKEE